MWITFPEKVPLKFGNPELLPLYLFSDMKTELKTNIKVMDKVLKSEYKDSITNNVALQAAIAETTKRSIETIKRWVRTDDPGLLNFQVLELLKRHHSLTSHEQILTNNKKEKAVA